MHFPPSASTKFGPPASGSDLVARQRLLEILQAGRTRRLTLIHAPAGFGKTTLAAQWRDVLADGGVSTAWLSVNPDDNNALWFLADLIEAVRRARPTLADELGQLLEEDGDNVERYVLSTLVSEIEATGEDLVLVVDDWHRVTNPRTIAALDFLLDIAGPRLQLVVTSRTRSGLPLGRLRVRDQLTEIDAVALRFDETESRRLLVELKGISLAPTDVLRLRDSTDGWVAALQLVSLSLKGASDPVELIARISGRHQSIGEYLAENVLDTLDPQTRRFLLTTSVPERLCGDLASALSGVELGQAMLERVEADDLFLRPLDEEREWFRYHHLFADYLRRRLQRDHPGEIRKLQLTAARWFADHAMISEAVDHALEADEARWAVEMVESHAMNWVEHSRMSTLLGIVAKLPAEHVRERSSLQLAIAWANCLLQRPGAAHDALARLERSSRLTKPDSGMLVEAAVIQGCIDIYADRIDRVVDLVAPSLMDPDACRPWVVSVAANIDTFAELYHFQFDKALARQQWAEPYHAGTTGPFSGVYGRCFAGVACRERLDIRAAERHFRAAVELARSSAGRYSHAARLAGALLGDLLYQQGHLDEASSLLEESQELGAESGVVDFMLASYATLARLRMLRGDVAAAASLLNEGALTADELNLPRLGARVAEERHHLELANDVNPRRASFTDPTDGIAAQTRWFTTVAHAEAILSSGADLDDLPSTVTELIEIADRDGRLWHRLLARILLARVLASCGQDEAAKAELLPAVHECLQTGLVRPLLDGGPPVVTLLASLREDLRREGKPSDDETARFLSRLLSTGRTQALEATAPPTLMDSPSVGVRLPHRPRAEDPLSDREVEILTLLAHGRSNKEIARSLDLGINTVKWYLKSLYVKLGVGRRVECVMEARRRGLLV